MLKLWTRLIVGLIFVFVTISAPMHAAAMGVMHEAASASTAPAAMPEMSGMSDACAKAMAAQMSAETSDAKAKPSKAPKGHANGCCSEGCNCPLSHCPATAPILALAEYTILHVEPMTGIGTETQTLRSYLVETLKRPPRA
ncbi:hypothetical protein [Asticcacaulis taihuensis]|uniref:Uncharacterized protein n=1 Tax=Asticcacaulis taihuensis TaxID=260084 RepID=A0A1G4PT32_9CAUL|nr:hypothetical protein [Asticcacaulis taihuensis]SCW35422.1 hypothetical protein SAMN02927928_0643 [Asticcacaulis taihuensis]